MGRCLLFYAVTLLLTGSLQVVSVVSSHLKCNRVSKLCKDDSECVLYTNVCDGEKDCKDGSDEEDCPTYCKNDQFQCAHGMKCIEKEQVCDDIPQCQDRSDEQQCMKHKENCIHHCDSHSHCLPENFLCDGVKNCLDGTDEANCEDSAEDGYQKEESVSTAPPAIKCSLGARPCMDNSDCVLYNHVCDGEEDCKDGSDEEECETACKADQFLCSHGKKCIEKSQVCDGVPQCQDRSDEANCAKDTEGCAHQCDDKSRCIPSSFLCDGERDCGDGSDEANCADLACSATEFKCTSGQCVLANMHCDGHPDCWDYSDEDSCAGMWLCPTKYRCPHSKECLVQEWVCDGDEDCKDGTDEKDCPVAPLSCREFQWSCDSNTQCVPMSWRCDGTKDCEDGGDEADCGPVTCLPHQFQCGSQECLDPSQVCNGIGNCADGSDEEGSCQIQCSEADELRCSQSCYSTPQGTRCHCSTGYRLLEDRQTCADIDECENPALGLCSQLCLNTLGSYKCDCHPGFIIHADGHHCKAQGEPFLLASIQTDLFIFGLQSHSLSVLSSSAKKAILSLDYDWKEKRVYWVSLHSESIRWSSLDVETTGTLITGIRADSVAVDWLGRNLYWIDGVNSHIVAIRLTTAPAQSLDRSVILDEDLDQPRSLALLPQKGLMFWTEIGNMMKIERAGMDGSERRAVVNSSLGWPGGVTVDAISDRVFWTDERLGTIGSASLDGDNIKILQMKETTNPFSVAVFNDILYWSDAKKRVVQAAHKNSGKKCQVLLKRPRQAFGVKIIHPWLQIGPESPCEKIYCSHMCVLAPGPRAVCKCPSGLLLAEDGLTCSSLVNPAFLLMLSPSTVTQIYLQSRHRATELKGWPEHLALQFTNVNEAAVMDYSLHDETLFVTDSGTNSLSAFKLKDSDLVSHGQILKLLGDTITAMAMDWVTLNIYWSSSKQPHLHVTSVRVAHTAVVLKEGIKRVGSIALHPPSGRVCFTNLGLEGTGSVVAVECADMDGAGRRVVWKDVVQPSSVVFSANGDAIYWADSALGIIGCAQFDGSQYKELKVGKGLIAVAQSDDTLLWMTVNDKTRLWYRDKQQQNRLWFEVDTQVVSLRAFSESSQSGSNQCAENNGNCQHICLATSGGRTCRCGHDHILVNTTHCSLDQSCPTGRRPCLDQLSCHSMEKFCDGHVDCSDHSDENCVNVEQWPGVEASAPIQLHSTSSPHSPSNVTELRSTVNVSVQFMNIDAQQCSQKLCNSNGRCVKADSGRAATMCMCSLGYSGDACQEHFLQTMQGPIIYAAAGLCVGAVLIAVTAAVVKRNRNTNMRIATSAAPKETSMMDLENKAENAFTANPSPEDAGKPEEVVSSVN